MNHTLSSKILKKFFGDGVCSRTWVTLIQMTRAISKLGESAKKQMDWEFEKIQPVTAQDNTGHYQLEEKVTYVRPLNLPPATDLNMSPVKIDVSFSVCTIGLF